MAHGGYYFVKMQIRILWTLVVFATQIYCSNAEDFIPCDTVVGGATNISFAKNETCIYIQCSEFQATVDIPTALLRGYKNYSHVVLVTEDGCVVKELDLRSSDGLIFVRLNVPFDSCGVKRKKSPGMIQYVGNPYVSYVGDFWEVYFINVTCSMKTELPRSKVNWEKVPKYMHECWSLADEFVLPAISNLSVAIHYLAYETRKGNSSLVYLYASNDISKIDFDSQSFVWSHILRQDMKMDIKKYWVGKTENGKAYGVAIPSEHRTIILVAYDETGKTASFSILPTCAYGHEYVVTSYPSRESYLIIATLFSMAWSLPVNVIVHDEKGKVVLKKQLEVFVTTYIRNVVTGYRVWSDMPIALFSIMLHAKVPYDSPIPSLTTDHMAEQLLPVTLWGSEYIIHPSDFGLNSSHSAGFILRIVTYKRPVQLLYFGCQKDNLVTTVPASSYRDMNVTITSPFIIRSTDGTNFMAVIIGKSGDEANSSSKGYPYMIQASPIRSFSTVAHSHPFNSNDMQFINLVKKEFAAVYFNEHKLPAAAWNAIPCSDDRSKPEYKTLDVKGHEAESSVFFTNSSPEIFASSVYTTARNGKGYNAYMGPAVFIHEQPQDSMCEIGWTYLSDSKKCIHISKKMATWRNAKLNCEKFLGKSSLAIVKDANVKEFVVLLMAQLRTEQAFLGIHLVNGKLQWVNGENVDSNILSLNPQGPGNPDINCGVLVVANHHRLNRKIFISASNCDTKRPYICEKDPLSPLTVVTTASPTAAPSINTTCNEIIGGAMNVSHAIHSNCIYSQCNENETVVDIPVELLEGYQDFSDIVLVTRDGCSVREYDIRNGGGLYFIRLIVPHYNCSTQISVLSGNTYHTNRPYISYIGDHWTIKYINTKCRATIGASTPYFHATTTAELSTSSMLSESTSSVTGNVITTSASLTEQVTTTTTTSTPINHCIPNPCRNNGSCASSSNGHLCTCPSDYFGADCDAVAPLENGIYLITTAKDVDFNVLLDFTTRNRRAVTGRQVAWFEVIGFSNMYGLRSVEHCPDSNSCLGFLSVNDNSSVYLASASLGPFMWIMVKEENGYLLKSASSNNYVTYHYEYDFRMSRNRTEAVIFQFQMTNKSIENSLHMTRFELNEKTEQTLPIDIIALPAGNASCPTSSEGVTVCTWFLPYHSSPKPLPTFLLLKTIRDNITSILRSNLSRSVMSFQIKSILIGSVHMVTTDSTHIKIVVTSSSKKLIAETETISLPAEDSRHHICFQNKQVHINGAAFNFTNVDPSWDDLLNSEFLFIAVGTDESVDFKSPGFIGQIDDFRVWCGSQSSEYIHSVASYYAECNGIKSSLYSQQTGDVIASATVKSFVITTPESACQYCKKGWTLGQGTCYRVVEKEEPAPNAVNLQNFSYKYCSPLEPQHSTLVSAYVKTKAAHISVARLVESVLRCSNKFAWIGLERANNQYIWRSDGTILNEARWIQGEPSLKEADACVGYKPSKNMTEWKSTSLQAPNIEPPVSLCDYGWAEKNCNSLHPHICQHEAYSFTPAKDTLLQIVITGGSFLLHLGSPAVFQLIREALAEIVNTVSDSMAGYVLYQIYESGQEPFLLASSDVKPIILSVIQSWSPREGENNLASTLKLFRDTSTNRSRRYINIVTMYSTEEQVSLQSRSSVQSESTPSVVIFTLGFMFAAKENLKQVASHPSCQCLFQGSVCPGGLAIRLLHCIKGTYVFDDLNFNLPTPTSVTSLSWTPTIGTTLEANTTAISLDSDAATLLLQYSTAQEYTTVTTAVEAATTALTPVAPDTTPVEEQSQESTTIIPDIRVETVSNTTATEESVRTETTTEMTTMLSSYTTVIESTTTPATMKTGFVTTASSNQVASCPSGYEGVNCTDRAPPSPGPSDFSCSVDLSGLFPSNGGRRKRSLTSLLVDIIEVNGGFIIRTLRGCPSGPYCMWFLNVQNERVMFNCPPKGYHIWIFIPLSDQDDYKIRSRFNGQFVQFASGKFQLSANASSALTFKLSSAPSSTSVNLTEEKISSLRVVFSQPRSAEAYVELPLSNSSTCFESTTVCFWFHAFSSSPVSFPHLSFSSAQNNYSVYEQSFVSTTLVRLEIRTLLTQGYTYQFSPLPKQHWHLACLLINATTVDIYIDALKLNWYSVAPNKPCPTAIKIAECRKARNSCFTGYLREANVWSKHLTVSEIHSLFTAVCSPFEGDVFPSSQKLSGVGLSHAEDITPRSICRYCTFGGTLSENTCYYLVETVQSTIEEYLLNTCAKSFDPNSKAASVKNFCNHASVASLIDAQLGYQLIKFPSISLKYMLPEGSYRWWLNTTLEENGNNTFWAAGQPNLSSGNCVVYRSTTSYINGTVLTGWPSSISGVLPQPSNYMWHSGNCSQRQPYICQMNAVFLDPEKNIQISVVLPSDHIPFESTLRDLVNIVYSSSTIFRFVEGNKTFSTSYPDAGRYLENRTKQIAPLSTESLLERLMGCDVYFSNRIQCMVIVTSENSSILSSLKTRNNPSIYVFALGLGNATLEVVQKLASKPEFAYMISNITSASDSLLGAFQQFLIECSQRNMSDICTGTCSTFPCENAGTCTADVTGFTCSCVDGYVGDRCQFNSSEVDCGNLGITVSIPADVIKFLSGTLTLNTTMPSDVVVYFSGHKNDSDCRVTSPLTTSNNRLAYQLYAPSPFNTCGLKQETVSALKVKVFGHAVYERITNISNIDTSVIVVNFSCFYQTRYKVGLRPDEGLSTLFRPLPNRLFSKELKKLGKINVDLKLFYDPPHKQPLPPNPTLVAGSFVYVSVFSASPLPSVMGIRIDECYMSASQDAANLTLILPIVTDNCAADNLAPKKVTLVKRDKINFMYQVFLWTGSNAELFMHCNTTICDVSNLGCSNINCTSNRVRRQATRYDLTPQHTLIKPIPISVIAVDRENQETTEADDAAYLIMKDNVHHYALAGLIIFTCLFFSISLIIILHCLRRQDPSKHVIHSKCSYRPGRSVSESLPHDWTVMHSACVSPSPHAEKVTSRRERIFATTESACRVPTSGKIETCEGVFNTSTSQQFKTFLGQQESDTQLQNALKVVEDSSRQQNTNNES